MSDLQKRFKRAVEYIQKLPSDAPYQSSNAEKLDFYALFKQATDGPNNTKAPSRLNVVAKMKW
jgi:diazepam-binding inhibitor (GABA receptor modulating acyl-CoA-binding protein)